MESQLSSSASAPVAASAASAVAPAPVDIHVAGVANVSIQAPVEPAMVSKAKACLSAIFNYSGPVVYDQDQIAKALGPMAAAFALDNRRMFHLHIKYPTFFCGPYADHIKCVGTAGPLMKNGLALPVSQPFDQVGAHYYVDAFAADSASILTRKVTLDSQSIRANNLVRTMLDRIQCPYKPIPTEGSRAMVSRETFMERADAVFHKTGDGALHALWNQAGTTGANFCFAGGFTSKLIDPSTGPIDASTCDADIFVYGSPEEQTRTINMIAHKLYEADATYGTIRGGVYNIRRLGRMDVQIVSSSYASPICILAGFDCPSVMSCWSAGTLWINAKFVQAFTTRVSNISKSKPLREPRIAKIVRNGFAIRLNKNVKQRCAIMAAINDAAHLTKSIATQCARLALTSSMPHHMRVAHVMSADSVQEVIVSDVDIAARMLISTKMDGQGYTRTGLEVSELAKFEVDRVNRTPDTITQVVIAGFNARFNFGYANIRQSANAVLHDVELLPAAVGKLTSIIDSVRASLAKINVTLDSSHIMDDHGIIRGILITRAQRNPLHMVFFTISLKCITENSMQLVLTEA